LYLHSFPTRRSSDLFIRSTHMLARRLSKNLVLFTILLCGMFSVFALADSQVRIVRLSDINGDVQIDHGSGFEKALRNMPITQGRSEEHTSELQSLRH